MAKALRSTFMSAACMPAHSCCLQEGVQVVKHVCFVLNPTAELTE